MDGNDYNSELARRTTQFAAYLDMMRRRARIEVEDSCFAIFDEEQPSAQDRPARSASIVKKLVLASDPTDGHSSFADGEESWPKDGWRDDHGEGVKRFVQFAFVYKWFLMDLPRNTLTADEARRLLRDKMGFFYLRDRPSFIDSLTSEQQIRLCDPFCKVYVYGDERGAAEDMAYIFFQLWHFPVDWRFYFTAFSGHRTDVRFEGGVPLS
jgi:hypothetical protein